MMNPDRKKGIEFNIKYWYIFFSAFYYFPIMLRNYRFLTYIYYYLVPLIFFLFNLKWILKKIKQLFTKSMLIFPICYLCMCIGAFIIPTILNTGDYSYLLDGPLASIAKKSIALFFLLLIYEKNVSKTSDIYEFMQYYIYSVILYILVTFLICIIPSMHDWVIENIYLTDFQRKKIVEATSYTRIGWGGFSVFGYTLQCSFAVICSSIMVFYYKNQRKLFWKFNCCIFILLIGNMLYGRSGLVISAVNIVVLLVTLYLDKQSKVLVYPFCCWAVISIILFFKERSEKIQNWYNWCFSVIQNFIDTGKLTTGSLESMYRMYFIPSFETLAVGEGRYMDGDLYYRSVDIGWLRPILYYGLFYSLLGYTAVVRLFFVVKERLQELKGNEKNAILLMWLLTLFFAELKGEIFYEVTALLLPVCVLDNSKGG